MNLAVCQPIKKIIAHNLSIYYENPGYGLYDFDQNGIHFARRGDVLVTRRGVPKAYIDFLSQCGFDLDGTLFVCADSSLPNTHEAFFDDRSIMEKTKKILSLTGADGNAVLDSFMITPKEAEWARMVGVNIVGVPEHYYEFGTKSSFRTLAKQNHVKIPMGYENQSRVIDGALSASLLFLRGAEEIVIKSDEGVAGLGSRRFLRGNFFAQLDSFKHFMETPHGVISDRELKFVLERWHSGVKSSPSVQLYIPQDGSVEIISTHIQLFYPDNALRYKGCLSGNYLTDDERKKLETESVRFGAVYAKKGYRGHLAFNTILLQDGQLLFVETNPRRVMSSYPRQIMKTIYGGNVSNIYYRSQHIKKDIWKGVGIDTVLSSLAPVLFSGVKKSGIVPFDYGLLFLSGGLSIVGFGSSKEEVNLLFDYVETI
ncbi:MAG: hypothetical protein WC835_03325 [Candidatus Paceibacterota bacterium]|jgi:hypothetical protein